MSTMTLADFWESLKIAARDSEPLTQEADEIMDTDPLDEEFRELERKVRQRECDHRETVEVTEFGKRPEVMCTNCNARFPLDDRP